MLLNVLNRIKRKNNIKENVQNRAKEVKTLCTFHLQPVKIFQFTFPHFSRILKSKFFLMNFVQFNKIFRKFVTAIVDCFLNFIIDF